MNSPSATPLLAVRGVTLQYKTKDHLVTATYRVDFDVQRSDRFILLGPSGCGKSTLLKAVGGYMKPVEGEIRLKGEAVTRPGPGLPWLTFVAFVVGMAAVTLELVADVQMHRFAKMRKPGEAMDRGLWAWSRHPNYFGEFGFWFALGLFGVAVAPADWWWLMAGAALMLALFLGASIPMMEERSLARRPDYQHVICRVSKFVPRPPR